MAAAFSRFNFHKSQTTIISAFWLVLSCAAIQAKSLPRLPAPICASEMRSLAPTILSYESAVLGSAAPPAINAADLLKNSLRSIVSFESLNVRPPDSDVPLALIEFQRRHCVVRIAACQSGREVLRARDAALTSPRP